ncbi:hypothetical protein PIROE2DRAFT_65194 [Piromyces sp. E2]|nr:hypothetical protein PIROE2DRAFT_65194 [Piromyces sp. E2]|eukprot:OUM57095.1 hypothetical protein PIROE2DRAFT_65194 [Piromyces sp. E2]
MKIKYISFLTILVGCVSAYDEFFGNIRRAELFEKTDFVVPKLTIKFNEQDYKNFFLKYQCEHDMNARYLIRNDECYVASWVNLDDAMEKAFQTHLLDKSLITDGEDLQIIKKSNKTISEFEHIVTKYTNRTLEDILSTGHGLIKIPDYSTENAGLTFDIDGYILIS